MLLFLHNCDKKEIIEVARKEENIGKQARDNLEN